MVETTSATEPLKRGAMKRSPASRLERLALSTLAAFPLIVAASTGLHVSAHTDMSSCGSQASPSASPAASPNAGEPSIDAAFLIVYAQLTHDSIDAVRYAEVDLRSKDVRALAAQERESAESDSEMLSMLPGFDSDADAYSAYAVVEQIKMELDLPAGVGGPESFGIGSGTAALCNSTGPHDDHYLALVSDLNQQKIDLAQAAIVAGSDPDVVAFAGTVLEREQTTQGSLISIIEARSFEPATPVGG